MGQRRNYHFGYSKGQKAEAYFCITINKNYVKSQQIISSHKFFQESIGVEFICKSRKDIVGMPADKTMQTVA